MALYHVWFSTKRRKWLLQGEICTLAEAAVQEAAANADIHLVECKAVIDHVHLLLRLTSSEQLPTVMKALKGRSARRVFQQVPELKLDGRTNNLWQRGYGWKLIKPGAEKTVRHYIRSQLERMEQFSR